MYVEERNLFKNKTLGKVFRSTNENKVSDIITRRGLYKDCHNRTHENQKNEVVRWPRFSKRTGIPPMRY